MLPTVDDPLLLRPTVMEIDLSALEHNFKLIRARVAPSQVLAVVKANAYGHGLIPCAKHFVELGADYLGVALVEEGIALRQAGVTAPVLVFGGLLGGQIRHYLDFDLDITASSLSKLQAINLTAKDAGKRARVHIKIDTGMRRIGVRPETAPQLFEELPKLQHVEFAGVFSHFVASDSPDSALTNEQFSLFQQALQALPSGSNVLRHIANTGAVLQHPQTYLDMVRPGIALYGVYPERHLEGMLDLRPAMTLRTKVVYFKVARRGEGVSYGHTWHAPEDTRLVTLPVGYGDGYTRALSGKAEVLIRGRRYPIAGRICMDQCMVNIGKGEAYNGDDVVLIGCQGEERITVAELAEQAGTVPHEVLTMTNLRVPRVYR